MTDDEKKAALDAMKVEVDALMKEPDDKIFLLPVMTNLKLNKMRYIAYRSIQTMTAVLEMPPEIKDDMLSAMVGIGIDKLVLDLTKMMLLDLLKKKLN